MLMEDYERDEICQKLGLTRSQLYRRMRAIRRSFCKMGFGEWLLPRRAARRRRRRQVQTDGRPMAIVGISWRRI